MNGPHNTPKFDYQKNAPKREWGSVSPQMLAPVSEQMVDVWSALDVPPRADSFPTPTRLNNTHSRFDVGSSRLFEGNEESFDYERSSHELNKTLEQLFPLKQGYLLGALVNTETPQAIKLQVHEQVAACFRGSSGAQPDHEWACSLFSSQHYRPLGTVLNTLLLCGPLSEAREIGCSSLWQSAHPDLTTLLKAAVRTESDASLIIKMTWYQNETDPVGAIEIIEAALLNPASNRKNLLRALDEIKEIREGAPSHPASVRPQRGDVWAEPRLSTLVVQSATAPDDRSFNDFVSTIIKDYPQFAAPALACLANTRKSELRKWTLQAFEGHAELRPYSKLLNALPVSACEPD